MIKQQPKPRISKEERDEIKQENKISKPAFNDLVRRARSRNALIGEPQIVNNELPNNFQFVP